MTTPTGAAPEQRKHSHYHKDIRHLETLDIYRVCDLFITNDPSGALAHAAKKILVAGGRGAKDIRKDIQEAIDTLQRKLEMLDEDQRAASCVVAGYDPGAGNDATVVAQFDERGLVMASICGIYAATSAAMAGSPAGDTKSQPEDPHAELRKTWKPGQRWQVKGKGFAVWDDLHTNEPGWNSSCEYRRHPGDIDPWYPDQSGAWVEVDSETRSMPKQLSGRTLVEILTKKERSSRKYAHIIKAANEVMWSNSESDGCRVVAYKIIF